MAVGGLFMLVTRVGLLRCVVANRLAQSPMGRHLTTGILLPVQREVNIRLVAGRRGYFSAVQRLSDC